MNVSPWVLTVGNRKQPIKRTLIDGDKEKTFVNLSQSRHLQYSNRLNKNESDLFFSQSNNDLTAVTNRGK